MSLTFNLNYPEGSAFVAVVCLYQLPLRSPFSSRVVSLLPAALPTGQ
jgi:hypothetical protein